MSTCPVQGGRRGQREHHDHFHWTQRRPGHRPGHETLRRAAADVGFPGFVVSDAQAVHNLRTHGFAADLTDAAARAIKVEVDLEMAMPARLRTCRRRSRPAWLMSRRSTPRSVVSWPRRSGWGYSTSPSSTMTEHVRSSQTQPTAGWRGRLRSGRRCCCNEGDLLP